MPAHRPSWRRTRIAVTAGASALALGGLLVIAPLAASAQPLPHHGADSISTEQPYGNDMLPAARNTDEDTRSYGDDGILAPQPGDDAASE